MAEGEKTPGDQVVEAEKTPGDQVVEAEENLGLAVAGVRSLTAMQPINNQTNVMSGWMVWMM